jgi:hypothetical protein
MKKYAVLKETKIVRIDDKTSIQVSTSIPDDEARRRYWQRHTPAPPMFKPMREYPLTVKGAFKEVPMGTVEHLAQIIDDSELPETE